MKSLQLRLTVGLFISIVCISFILWWLRGQSFSYLAEEVLVSRMKQDSVSLLGKIHIDAANNISLDSNYIEPIFIKPFSGYYYRIIANGQVINSPSLMEEELDIPKLKSGEALRIYSKGPMQQPLFILIYGFKKQGQVITIAMAENLNLVLRRITSIQYWYSGISVALMFLLLVIQIIILRSGFSRLERIQHQIRALEQGEIKQLDTDVPNEVSELVREINWLLTVQNQRLQRSRDELGDLAHALKTPLTVLQQLLYDERAIAHSEIFHIMKTQTSTMQKIMERVLKRARLAGAGPTLMTFDVHQEITDLIQVLQSMYRKKNLDINFSAPNVGSLLIDREDMLELTGNLLDNACKWAKSRVTIKLFIDRGVHLIVEDDGAGVSEENIPALVQRGVRLDESVSGHGLGLSIVQLIVENYNGQLILGRSNELGGFSVEVRLKTVKSFSGKSKEQHPVS